MSRISIKECVPRLDKARRMVACSGQCNLRAHPSRADGHDGASARADTGCPACMFRKVASEARSKRASFGGAAWLERCATAWLASVSESETLQRARGDGSCQRVRLMQASSLEAPRSTITWHLRAALPPRSKSRLGLLAALAPLLPPTKSKIKRRKTAGATSHLCERT